MARRVRRSFVGRLVFFVGMPPVAFVVDVLVAGLLLPLLPLIFSAGALSARPTPAIKLLVLFEAFTLSTTIIGVFSGAAVVDPFCEANVVGVVVVAAKVSG